MATGYEVQMYNDLRQISMNTNRIANCLEEMVKMLRVELAEEEEKS